MAVRILGVNGGIRAGGSADRALRVAFTALEAEEAHCEAFDISTLPLMDGRPDDAYPASVGAWRAACGAADALVITVPSFHGAMPGGLKNALDFLGMEQVGGKPFALIGIATGDAEPGVTDTARVLRHIGGVAAVPDVVISRSGEHWGPGEKPANAAIGVAMAKVTKDLLDVCELHAAGRLPVP